MRDGPYLRYRPRVLAGEGPAGSSLPTDAVHTCDLCHTTRWPVWEFGGECIGNGELCGPCGMQSGLGSRAVCLTWLADISIEPPIDCVRDSTIGRSQPHTFNYLLPLVILFKILPQSSSYLEPIAYSFAGLI